MADRRSETFRHVLNTLRERLIAGAYPADARLAAADLAREFGLSPTPMREVLARLCGEGLLEDRRGEGFFLRRLSARDIAALSQLAALHLRLVLEPGGTRGGPGADPAGVEAEVGDPVRAADRLFAAWMVRGGSRLAAESFARVQAQLARARRLEPAVFDDLEAEVRALAGAAPEVRGALVRSFFARRTRAAGRLADALEQAARRGET